MHEEGNNILKQIFEQIPLEVIEKQVEQEYGITIEIKEDENSEKQFWQRAAFNSLAKHYENEPDYSDVILMEPNPVYKPWKKDQ